MELKFCYGLMALMILFGLENWDLLWGLHIDVCAWPHHYDFSELCSTYLCRWKGFISKFLLKVFNRIWIKNSFFQAIFLICIRDVFDLQWLLNLTSIKLPGLEEDLVFCYLGYPVHLLQLADSLLKSDLFIFKHAKKSLV